MGQTKTGSLIAYRNAGNGPLAVSFTPINNGKHIAAGGGGSSDRVFINDLNGDGKVEYVFVGKDGKIVWWRNEGP